MLAVPISWMQSLSRLIGLIDPRRSHRGEGAQRGNSRRVMAVSKSYRYSACLLAVAASVLAGCGSSGGGGTSAQAGGSGGKGGSSASTKAPVIIGAPVSITGGLQPWGGADLNMAQLAVQDINKAGGVLGGRPLKIVSVDDKSDYAANGAAAALSTISSGAKVIVTDCDDGWGAPAQTAAAAKGIPSLSWCAGAPKFGVKGLGPLTNSGGIATPNEAAVPAEWGYSVKKWRKAYLLNDPTLAYDTTYCNNFKKRFTQLGGKVVGQDEFQQNDSSIATQITRLKGVSPAPDVIVVCSVPPGGASAIRQLRAAGVNTAIMTSDGMAGNEWLPSVPGLKNAYVSTYADQNGSDPISKINQLTARWKAAYHSNVPIPDVFNAYADIQLIASAINKAGSDNPAAIGKALAATTNVPTIFGPHSFQPGYNLSFTSPVAILSIHNGTTTFVTRRRPEINAVSLLNP